MTDHELDQIMIHRWPGILRRAMVDGDDFTRGFARSIARAYKRPGWTPSPKQEHIMRALLREMRGPVGNPELIEEEGDDQAA